MIVLDAAAIIAWLRDEPGADTVEELLRERPVTMSPISVAEVIDRMVRLAGVTPASIAGDLAQLGVLDPPPLTAEVARRAGVLRSRRYHRRDRALSLADCVVVETGRAMSGTVASSDRALLDTCLDEHVEVAPLPSSTGSIWRPPPGR